MKRCCGFGLWGRTSGGAVIRNVLLVCGWLAVASPVAAQGSGAWEKGWIDVNFGTASAAENEYDSIYVTTLFQEAAGFGAGYSLPRGGSFDVGGGYMFTPRIGIGVSLAGTAHEDHAALAISIPHPFVFNASAEDATTTTGTLTRAEGAWHVGAMLVAVQTPRFRVRLFGGPSYFRAEQDIISNIRYSQVYQIFGRTNGVDITTYETEKAVGTGWGGHVGGDVSVFFNRVVGVGMMVRVSRASVDIDDYGGEESRKVGGVQFGGGLRLKF